VTKPPWPGSPSTSIRNCGAFWWTPRPAKVVELRYFGGLTEEEIEAALKISPRTIRRDWHFVKAWLLRELSHTIRKPSGHQI
jgi:hypothetical protein